jgi:hypothetical protein
MKRALIGLALAVACADPTIPDRQDRYAFDDGFGEVFRWPADRLPVRYFADTRGPMAALVARALGVWEEQFLYGEFTGVLVSDSASADVIVRWGGTVPSDVPPDTGAPVTSCSGVTMLAIDSASNSIEDQIIVTANNLLVPVSAGQMIACYRRVIAHEVGHSLGLFQHSAQLDDLMAGQPLVERPGRRDRVTAEVLYHTTPTIGPPPR